jgi:fimbrial chaperone protein
MMMTERYKAKAARLAALLLFLGGYPLLAAASVSVSPVLVELSENHSKEVVRISNAGDTTKSFEVDVVAWSQSDVDREIYQPTDELLVVPPLFTLEPGETQVVRIGMMRRADETREVAYRVFFTELAGPELGKESATAINMRLRFGIPAFVAPLAPAAPGIEFAGLQTIDNQPFMKLHNAGNIRVKINEVRYRPPGSQNKEVSPAVFYLHAGKTGFLPLEVADHLAAGTVELDTDTAGTLEYALAGPH